MEKLLKYKSDIEIYEYSKGCYELIAHSRQSNDAIKAATVADKIEFIKLQRNIPDVIECQ